MIGHTRDPDDPDAPLFTDGRQIPPGAVSYLDLKCRDCAAHLHVATGAEVTLLVLDHQDGCPALARWEAAGAR